jgi:hypothetical protein
MSKPRPGWTPPNPFPKGIGGNPRGRPKGSRDRTPRNVWELLRSRGDRDPLDILSEFASSQLVEPNLRIQAAVALAGYYHGKRPAMRFVEGITGLRAPASIEEARQYIARLAYLVAIGRIDIDGAEAIKSQLQSFIDATVGSEVDQRLRALEEMARQQQAAGTGFGATIVVESTLPRMPGTEDMIMPGDRPAIDLQSAKPPNPWAAPDVAAGLDATPQAAANPGAEAPKRKRGRGRPRKFADQVPDPPPTPPPPDDEGDPFEE